MSLPSWEKLTDGLRGWHCTFGGSGGNCYAHWCHDGTWVDVASDSIFSLKTKVLAWRIQNGLWPDDDPSPEPPPKPLATPAQPKKNPYERQFG